MRRYRQGEIEKIFPDVPRKTLIYWAWQGLVEWADETRDGRGIHREYGLWNLLQIAIVRELTEFGVTHDVIRWVMDSYFKDFLQGPPLPQARPIVRDRNGKKASETNAIEKVLVLMKPKAGRDRQWKSGAFDLRDPSNMGDCFKGNSASGFVILNLPVIAEQIEVGIKKARLE